MAAIRAANGAAIQAGLYPNPNFGYEADNVDSADTAGFQGGFFEQSIKTAGKLKLARAAAQVGVANAQVALRKAQVDLAHQVRAAYFAVLWRKRMCASADRWRNSLTMRIRCRSI